MSVFFFFGALFSLPNIQRVKKGAKVVLKDVIFANCILTDLSFPLRWPGASLSDGGHFNLPRCEVAVRTTLSASLDYLNFTVLHNKNHFSGIFLGRRLSGNLKPF